MGTRTVTGTVYRPDGTAYASATVTFTLITPFVTASEYYPAIDHSETTDALGQFSTALGVPDTGTAYYRVLLPTNKWYEFYIAAGAAVDLVTLVTITGTSVAQDDLQTLLDNNNVFTIASKTDTYVILASDEYIRCNGTFTVTLPAATGSGSPYIVKNVGSGTITVAATGSDLIDGAASVTLSSMVRYGFIDAAAATWDSV